VLNIDGSEFIFVAVIALLVLGPERMPQLVRKAGRIVGELRRMSSGFQAEFRDAFAEPISAVNEVKSTVNATVSDFRKTVQTAATFEGEADCSTMAETASPSMADTATPYMAPASWAMPDAAKAVDLGAPVDDAPVARSSVDDGTGAAGPSAVSAETIDP
jgi:sec-independent protein translocase protein TatB